MNHLLKNLGSRMLNWALGEEVNLESQVLDESYMFSLVTQGDSLYQDFYTEVRFEGEKNGQGRGRREMRDNH